MLYGTTAEWIAGLPGLRDLLRLDREDALLFAAQARLDGDALGQETWELIAVRSDRDLLRVDAQLAYVDRQAARMLEEHAGTTEA